MIDPIPFEIDLTDSGAHSSPPRDEPREESLVSGADGCELDAETAAKAAAGATEPAAGAADTAHDTAAHLIGGEITLEAALEALLLVAEGPVDPAELAAFLDQPVIRIEQALADLAGQYASTRRGFELREVAGCWRFYTARHVAPVVELHVTDGRHGRLSRAALETLAVVAYRQPVSRARVGSIRGVNVDGVIRTLVGRGLVAEAATDPETGAVLFGTTGYFLERMGIESIAQLPPVADYLPDGAGLDELIDPTG